MLTKCFPLKSGNCIDDTKRANILNKQYCSVFSRPTKDTPPINSPPAESVIDDIDLQQNGVLELLKSAKPHKATGPDSVSARFLKEFSLKIAPALTLLYKNSLKQEALPQEWLHAYIFLSTKEAIKTEAQLKIINLSH